MRGHDLIQRAIYFRQDCTEPMHDLLREVADFLEANPTVEDICLEIDIRTRVSEPLEEGALCYQEHEAVIRFDLTKEFDDYTIKELRVNI